MHVYLNIYIYSVCLYIYTYTRIHVSILHIPVAGLCFASYLHESFIRVPFRCWEDTFGPLSRTWDVFWALVLSPVWDEVPRNSMGMNLFNQKHVETLING